MRRCLVPCAVGSRPRVIWRRLNATLQIGQGVLQPTDQTRPIPFEAARAYFTFDPSDQAMRFDEISVISDWVTGTAEGTAFLDRMDDGALSGLLGQLRISETTLNLAGAYPEPITLTGAAADFKLQLDPFTLTLGQLFIEDQGHRLHLHGDLRASEDGWRAAFDGQMDALTPERLVALWPPSAIPKTRSWLDRNLSGGRLNDLNIVLRAEPGRRPNVYLDFDYANTQIQFMRTMPPITGATGHASLLNNRFVTTATSGRVIADDGGAVDVAGTSFIIPDTSIRKGAPAVVRLQGRGSITGVLSLLNREPLRVMDKPGLPVTLAGGDTVFQGTLALPLKQRVEFEEVSFYVDGLARDVTSDILVPGHDLSAPTLTINATDGGVQIVGEGRISGVPFNAEWTQVFGVPGAGSSLQGDIELGPDTLEAFQIALPPGSVTGSGVGQLTVDLPQGAPPILELSTDLSGLEIRIPELGWRKPPDQAGSLNLVAQMGQPAVVSALTLDAPGLRAEGTVRPAEGGGLVVAEFSRVRRGDWLDVRARLRGQGAGRPPTVQVLGGSLDLRRATFGSSGGRGTAPAGDNALTVRLDQLQVTDTITLTGFEGQFAARGGLRGPFQAQINNSTPISGQVAPEDGRTAVRITSNDAGGVFRDAGIVRQAYEGSFDMTLRPVGEPGNFDGQIAISNTYVRDAPAMAALLNAVSIVGLLTELSGQGILFSEVAAQFRLSPSRITVSESRATGPSMGLTMDGVFDVPNQRLNMQGVISPVYLLNQIGGILAPRRGEGLFGFTYTLTGSTQSPQVAVNPLSGLTPGVFREIFRTEPPPAASSSGDAPLLPPTAPLPQAPAGGDR